MIIVKKRILTTTNPDNKYITGNIWWIIASLPDIRQRYERCITKPDSRTEGDIKFLRWFNSIPDKSVAETLQFIKKLEMKIRLGLFWDDERVKQVAKKWGLDDTYEHGSWD